MMSLPETSQTVSRKVKDFLPHLLEEPDLTVPRINIPKTLIPIVAPLYSERFPETFLMANYHTEEPHRPCAIRHCTQKDAKA